jgi:hypothetical protein
MTLSKRLMIMLAFVALLVPAAAFARDTQAASVHLRERPVLHIASPQPGGRDQPVAWVTFRTRHHLDARLIVVRFADRSGRSYGGGTSDCVRSTFVDDNGRRAQRPGQRYVVPVYVRDGIGRTRPKRLASQFTLTAHAFHVTPGKRSAPAC